MTFIPPELLNAVGWGSETISYRRVFLLLWRVTPRDTYHRHRWLITLPWGFRLQWRPQPKNQTYDRLEVHHD